MRLWLDDRLVSDQPGDAQGATRNGRVPLRTGYHRLRLEYSHVSGDAGLRLAWSEPAWWSRTYVPVISFGR